MTTQYTSENKKPGWEHARELETYRAAPERHGESRFWLIVGCGFCAFVAGLLIASFKLTP